ncbi:MAG: lysine biosynthesis protein LysW [Candidatus Dormiibacterota bacterium]|jgi:lysine biosynthesis protein LysW
MDDSGAAAKRCPDCGAELDLGEVQEVGDLVDCPNCGATFELVALAPLTLAPFEDEEK